MRIRKGVPTSDDERRSETVRDHSATVPRGDDADFLVETFDVSPHEAANLVGGEDADAEAVQDEVRTRNPHADDQRVPSGDTEDDAPLPEGDVDDIVPDNDEVREKPVLRDTNGRSGAG